ncbi:MAG: alpha/beta fold hydrolase [Streptomyces sp.]|uniref:alpha/beta hydrolase n=1 Tax=Streptomyces sp. TaxID=1931 RepID=UPI0025E2B0FF|nr:alpha/beta hydrolase [Streptomyces sp.]MBW8796089.1 alpha/beta fold hydrolase [Streptomyces sp.]
MPAVPRHRAALRRCAGAGAVALALLGAGLPATPAAAGAEQPDLTPFYRQQVRWTACKDVELPKDMQCAKVTVPLDYARPAAGTLDLALSRYRATGKSRGSVLLNFGGPGGSGVSQLGQDAKEFMGLTNGYDLVGFDPRGVGRSSPVSCGDGTGDPSADAGDDEPPDVARPQALMKALKQLTLRCTRNSGPVLSHIGTVNASRDLDVIRQALGDRKLNYLGFSYGTRLGAVYAAQFPYNVGRIALDGVDTLTESLAEQGVAGARGQQTALDDFLDWCVTDRGCPFGQDRRKAGDAVVKLVRSLDEDPVPSDFGGPFTGQDLVDAVGQGLYGKDLWPLLERALAALTDDGDTRGLQNLSSGGYALPHGQHRPGGGLVGSADIPVDNLSAALMAINCADDPDRPSAGRLTRDLARLDKEYQQASPVFGRFRLTQVLLCYGRPRGTDFIRDEVKNVPSAPMLLVGTRGDPATPYSWTVETAKRLGPAAVVLDNRGDGHTGYTSSTCVHAKVDDFLLYGTLPPDGSSCPADGDGGAVTDSSD